MANNEMKIKDMPIVTKEEKLAHEELLKRAKHVKLTDNATEHLVLVAEEALEEIKLQHARK